MENKRRRSASPLLVAVGCSLTAAAALYLTLALIAEIAAVPTAGPGIASDAWTPGTAITALVFGHGAFTGSFEVLSIGFGLVMIAAVSIVAGAIGTALIVYALGRTPHPLAAALLGAAWGLAAEILVLNLLCNWLQPENGIYRSLPSWGWFVAMGAWGATLGLSLSRKGRAARPLRPPAAEGSGGGFARRSPQFSGDRSPGPLPDAAK